MWFSHWIRALLGRHISQHSGVSDRQIQILLCRSAVDETVSVLDWPQPYIVFVLVQVGAVGDPGLHFEPECSFLQRFISLGWGIEARPDRQSSTLQHGGH